MSDALQRLPTTALTRHGCRVLKGMFIWGEDLLVALLKGRAWRGAAVPRAMVYTLTQRRLDSVAAPALRALGRSASRWAQWRFQWSCYHQVAIFHCLWRHRTALTDAWIRDHVVVDGHMPPGGAILLTVHHTSQALGAARLAAEVERCGIVTRLSTIADEPLFRRAFGANVFVPIHGMRDAVRFLQSAGYLFILPDLYPIAGSAGMILGKQVACAPGVVWLAQRSGKPILPCMVIPEGDRWRIWIGTPVAATDDGVARAVEECIRRAPSSWWIAGWLQWHAAPSAPAD